MVIIVAAGLIAITVISILVRDQLEYRARAHRCVCRPDPVLGVMSISDN